MGLCGKVTAPVRPTERRRVPGTGWMSQNTKNHFTASLGEFVGTFLFLFFAFGGTQVAQTTDVRSGKTQTTMYDANPAALLYIALSFGFSLAVTAWVFFRISGGLFNPAVTLGMYIVGAVPPLRSLYIFIAQIIGGIAASAVISGLLPGQLTVRPSLTKGTSVAQGLFIEMFCTCLLVFSIFMLAAEKHKATFLAPIGIGLALFIGELVSVFYTGGALNPCRAFGPAVVTGTFESYHWIYWIGPALGALLASAFYKLIKILEYETANPEQDADGMVHAYVEPTPLGQTARPFSKDSGVAHEGQDPLGPDSCAVQGENCGIDGRGVQEVAQVARYEREGRLEEGLERGG